MRKRLLLAGGLIVALAGVGLGVAGALEGNGRPTVYTPPSRGDVKAVAEKCKDDPKTCPADPVDDFVGQTGYVPIADPSGAWRVVGYAKQADLLSADRTADTPVPIYADATGRVQVGTTSGTEGTKVGS